MKYWNPGHPISELWTRKLLQKKKEQQSAHKSPMHFTFPCFGCPARVLQSFTHFTEPARSGEGGGHNRPCSATGRPPWRLSIWANNRSASEVCCPEAAPSLNVMSSALCNIIKQIRIHYSPRTYSLTDTAPFAHVRSPLADSRRAHSVAITRIAPLSDFDGVCWWGLQEILLLYSEL